ncbi:RluA family pseudouridine synthase [Bariatricus massiliensis]|uniref:Pseudouridine synthase n=1 Tax=Bariatricus massiliensis TaxID=1745713 RepID=A0ABS8DBL8_9FIRM|nr:RluA family pseudouridine synthase [Bariatricus massiliensis]MCB7303694.1 RluA family pseudouridine synthase [Bariatricus massiliensis]MCB7373110.1 RluA family pseudouridine synthase [Bariatricus massiliensis]MCB7385780.1 RluA family pseudouridine synthase [Bariatricus massiliensis]MCB7409942.1 RluA family pseudouridine synthase [Bariatricus massiliensis]MCQ5253090.1 RluA family pseudouridine synthase [Bariatricus massiliensis]
MKRILAYNITEEYDGSTIQKFLKAHSYSAQIIRRLKETKEGITKNGIWARVGEPLCSGDVLSLTLVEKASSENIVPSPLPLSIVYEDEDLMIVNKAADMPIHPSQGNYDNTLANACAYYYQQKGGPFVYRCINRLDRDTTGLLILAKNMYSASLLSGMCADRKIHRQYVALAQGLTPGSGTITAPIARAPGSTIERMVDFSTGEYACTHFRRLAYKNGYSLISLELDTGRTHQIRVHMKHIGHPLPGDFLYNPDYTIIGRQALHSWRLSFQHPITGIPLCFTASLPDDMAYIGQDSLQQYLPAGL